MDILREICANAAVPVVGGGRIRRMEDVKKLLYAGCSQAVLDLNSEEQAAVLEEVALKFGKEKIIAAADGPEQILRMQGPIGSFTSEIFLLHGAGGREASLISPVPVTPFLPRSFPGQDHRSARPAQHQRFIRAGGHGKCEQYRRAQKAVSGKSDSRSAV